MLWVYIVALAIILVAIVVVLIRLIWNLRLNNFQKRNKMPISRTNKLKFGTNITTFSLLLMAGVFTVVSGASYIDGITPNSVYFPTYEEESIVYKKAKPFESQQELENILTKIYQNNDLMYGSNFWFGTGGIKNTGDAVPEAGAPVLTEMPEGGSRPNISDTYNQVEGVTEADILKIDPTGKNLFYGPRYSNLLYKIELDDDGNHMGSYEVLEFEDFIFTEMLLSGQYVVVFGNVYEDQPMEDFVYLEMMYYWRHSKSSYKLIDIESFEVVKEGFVEGNILEVRQVADVIYILSSRYIEFTDNKPINLPAFNNVYYFEGASNSYAFTKITSINLTNLETHEIGFMGDNSGFFMGENFIVLTNVKWDNYVESSNVFYHRTSVIAIRYNNLGELTYVGSNEIEGVVLNQYCIDDYEGLIKVVTTYGRNHKNSLYILKPKEGVDELEIIGLLNEGIGKPGEDVKSASFNKHILKVVTFRQIDPLYTIDLSDPTKPIIISEIEEPGYSSSLVIWDEEGNTIGLGYTATLDGRITGFKVSAYRHDDDEPTQTIEIPYDNFNYIWIPAVYNQRQNLLVNKELGLYGFLISRTTYFYHQDIYSFASYTEAFLLEVDFSQELPLSRLLLSEEPFEDELEKMVLVNDSIHLLSKNADFVYSISQRKLLETLELSE